MTDFRVAAVLGGDFAGREQSREGYQSQHTKKPGWSEHRLRL
jgi:hypothetical protein